MPTNFDFFFEKIKLCFYLVRLWFNWPWLLKHSPFPDLLLIRLLLAYARGFLPISPARQLLRIYVLPYLLFEGSYTFVVGDFQGGWYFHAAVEDLISYCLHCWPVLLWCYKEAMAGREERYVRSGWSASYLSPCSARHWICCENCTTVTQVQHASRIY